jgi:hypothetical protein
VVHPLVRLGLGVSQLDTRLVVVLVAGTRAARLQHLGHLKVHQVALSLTHENALHDLDISDVLDVCAEVEIFFNFAAAFFVQLAMS